MSSTLEASIFMGKNYSENLRSIKIPQNVQSASREALLYVFQDNEAVIKMIIKGRSPAMRHVSRTHRVALDWLFDRIILDPKIQIKYIDTKNQLADILTKGNFTRDAWNHLSCLFNISHFSSAECSEEMSRRIQKESGEEGATAKSRPMMNLIARSNERAPSAPSSIASESPGKTRHESQSPLSPQAEKYDRTGRPVVCSQRASQTRSSRESKNSILEEDANHDRTVGPGVCRLWTKPQTCGFQDFLFVLHLDRLQLTSVCCNRREV